MISRDQQILLKRAQAQAGLSDGDYRDALEAVSGMAGCRSSKDARLGDGHVDRLMGYFEAIYWRGVDAGVLQGPSKGNAVFRQRGFWAGRNPAGNTSRDRWAADDVTSQVAVAEQAMARLGYGERYLSAIAGRVGDSTGRRYLAALNRTLAAKVKKKVAGEAPF